MTDEEFAGLDFGVGVVRGARSFRVTTDGELTGIVYHQVWAPGENLAICRRTPLFETVWTVNADGFNIPTVVPDTRYQSLPDTMTSCKHGFYAYYDGSNNFRQTGNFCAGVIEGYGEVVIGTRGFRAMKARIVALQPDTPTQLEACFNNYPDIPLFDSFDSMLAEFPPDVPERTTP
jgi:hypothetical protein